jgi:hypothetical protein
MRSAGLRLVPLDCPGCGATLAAQGEDVVFYCTSCRNGYRLRTDESGLEPVEVAFTVLKDRVATTYRPFWTLPATVELHDRDAAGGGIGRLLGALLGDRGSGAGSTYETTFVVPAFDCPLEQATALTQRYTEAFPELGEKLGEQLTGGVYSLGDARTLAEYAFLDAQVRQPDTLKQLRYTLDFHGGRLLGVPFIEEHGQQRDAIFGLPCDKGTGGES